MLPENYIKAISYIAAAYSVGDTLEAERDMAKKIGIGRQTLREVFAILRAGGVVYIEHGKSKILTADPRLVLVVK